MGVVSMKNTKLLALAVLIATSGVTLYVPPTETVQAKEVQATKQYKDQFTNKSARETVFKGVRYVSILNKKDYEGTIKLKQLTKPYKNLNQPQKGLKYKRTVMFNQTVFKDGKGYKYVNKATKELQSFKLKGTSLEMVKGILHYKKKPFTGQVGTHTGYLGAYVLPNPNKPEHVKNNYNSMVEEFEKTEISYYFYKGKLTVVK